MAHKLFREWTVCKCTGPYDRPVKIAVHYVLFLLFVILERLSLFLGYRINFLSFAGTQ